MNIDREHRLELSLRNCLALARRMQSKDPDAWGHVIRFCREAGIEPSILRDAEPGGDPLEARAAEIEEKPGQLLVVDLQNGDVEARTDLLAGLVAALETHTVIATVAGSAQQQLGEDVAATRAKQLEATEAVRAAKTALETHNATEREDVSRALDLLDELRNTAIPVARLREEMLKPAREYLKARLVALGG